jgi:hypothetical protein
VVFPGGNQELLSALKIKFPGSAEPWPYYVRADSPNDDPALLESEVPPGFETTCATFNEQWRNVTVQGYICCLADTEAILPRVRELLSELEEIAKRPISSSEAANAVGVVLDCGRKALKSFGDSTVTPWPGPRDLAELHAIIHASADPETVNSIRQTAGKVVAVVDRELLRDANSFVGRWNATI